MRNLTLLPLLCFPFAAHLAAVKAVYWPLVICLAFWSVLVFTRAHNRGVLYRMILVLAPAILLGAIYFPALGQQLLPVPSLIVFLSLAYCFGTTLQPGSRPLVTRIAAALGDPLDADLLHYTRQVTLVWFCFFLALFAISLFLWLYATREFWSLFSNFAAYGLVLLMFVAEYSVRRQRFAFAREQRFSDFLRALSRIEPRELLR